MESITVLILIEKAFYCNLAKWMSGISALKSWRSSCRVRLHTFGTLLHKSHVSFLSILFVFNHLLGSCLLIKDDLCSFGRVMAELELLQCTIWVGRSSFLLLPIGSYVTNKHQLFPPLLFLLLCSFSFPTISFYASPFSRSLSVCCTFLNGLFCVVFQKLAFFAAADLIKASLRSLCNYLHFIPVLFVSFLTFPPLYYYLPRGWHILKLNRRCLVWIRVQIGKDVGQNLQSKSHSKNRSYWVMQLPKEGPFPKLCFEVCLFECCI